MKLSGKRLWCYYLVDNSLDFLRRDKALYMFMFFFLHIFCRPFIPADSIFYSRNSSEKNEREKSFYGS